MKQACNGTGQKKRKEKKRREILRRPIRQGFDATSNDGSGKEKLLCTSLLIGNTAKSGGGEALALPRSHRLQSSKVFYFGRGRKNHWRFVHTREQLIFLFFSFFSFCFFNFIFYMSVN